MLDRNIFTIQQLELKFQDIIEFENLIEFEVLLIINNLRSFSFFFLKFPKSSKMFLNMNNFRMLDFQIHYINYFRL